jgi:hypothetical protein
MANKKKVGYNFIGKEVQSSEFRVDKDFYLERSKAQAYINALYLNTSGKVIAQPVATKDTVLVDDAAAITTSNMLGGIMSITPTAARSKATPSSTDLITTWALTERQQYVDVAIANLASAYDLTVTMGSGVTALGNTVVPAGTSKMFRFIVNNAAVSTLVCYVLAGVDAGVGVNTIVAGDGIDVSGATGDVTVTAETATDSNPGVVELATTGEADTGTATDKAVTPAGLKSHVDARYSYQYISLSANATTPSDSDWMYASGNGIGNHTYNSNGAAGGVTPHNTDGSASTITIAKNTVSGGIIVPYASVLVGFTAQTRSNADRQQAVGIFTGTPDWNDYDDITAYLRGYSAQDISAGPDTSYSIRPVYHSVLDVNYTLAAGECLWFALKDLSGAGGGCIASATIVLKTLIP